MKRFNTFILAIALVSTLFGGAVAHAASASMSLSPASATRYVGSTFSVGIYENSGADQVNVAEASLAFDASQLTMTGISCSSAFEIAAPGSANGISCGTVTPKTGSQLVGTATFRTLVGNGSGAITINNAHVYANDGSGTDIIGGTSGANYSFATPVAVPVTPTPEPTPVPVVVAKIFTVNITVVDSRGNIVKGASVTFNGKTATTGSNGKASFTGVKSGSYAVSASANNLKVSTTITVNENNKTTQNFMVTLPRAKSSSRFGLVIGGTTGAAILILGGYALSRKRGITTFGKKATSVAAAKKAGKPAPQLATAKR